MIWCDENNIELLQFKNNTENLKKFVEFVIMLSKQQGEYRLMEKIYREKFDKSHLFQTMKMTVCDFN